MNGYEEVSNYIERFWKSKYVCDVVCLIGTSFDGANYCKTVEIASPDENYTGVFDFVSRIAVFSDGGKMSLSNGRFYEVLEV